MQEHLQKFIEETTRKIEYQRLMTERAKELFSNIDIGQRNVGRSWVRKIEGAYWLPYVDFHNDQFREILLTKECKRIFASDYAAAFLDSAIQFEESGERIHLIVRDRYANALDLEEIKALPYVPPHVALCSVMDMGEVGCFERSSVDHLVQELRNGINAADGPVVGVFLHWGVDQERYRRLIEIQIPLQDENDCIR